MAKIKAFKGIRPQQEYAEYVASKPYDVLNTEEARVEAEGNPYSFLRVVKPEISLPEGTDPYSPEVYAKGKENFYSLLKDGILFQDETNNLYIYRQVMGRYSQTGIVACSSVQDYFDDIIKKHEYTRPQKEQDRINHMKTTGIHSGPVFLTYPDVSEIDEIVNGITSREPQYDFTANDEVRHTLWAITEADVSAKLVTLFWEKVKATYIADGHHRAASSAKVGKELAEHNPNHTGDEDYNWFLSVLFPASEVNIIDYNRVVEDLNGMKKDAFLEALEQKFDVKQVHDPYKPASKYKYGMYLDHQWYELTSKLGTYDPADPVKKLDAYILQENLFHELLDIEDPRTNNRIDFVGGIRGLKELERRVDSGDMAVAFSLFPVTIEELIGIADSGNVMPPKSTWFEPKLRSGLVVHRFLEE